MFSEPEHAMELKKLAETRLDISDFRSAMWGATVEGGWPTPVVMATLGEKTVEQVKRWPKLGNPEDAEAFVEESIKRRSRYYVFESIPKSGEAMHGDPLPTPSPELQAAIVKAAHSRGLITVAHALSQNTTMKVLEAGTDGLAHCFCDQAPKKELLEAYKRNNTFLIPTLVVVATLTGEEKESSTDLVRHTLSENILDEPTKKCFCQRMMMGKEGCSVEYCYETVKMLKAGGIDIIAGTDTATGLAGTAFGLSLHQELSLYTTRCSFTPEEALRSATSTTARRFNMRDRGRIQEGLRADLLLVKGDPSTDIRCTMDISEVWRGGKAEA